MTTTNTTVHHLTNGEANWSFRITGDSAKVTQTTTYGIVKVEDKISTAAQARKFYATAKKYGCTEGFTKLDAYRKLTTEAQFAAYIDANYDLNSDNDPETVLALEEEFRACGCLNVAA